MIVVGGMLASLLVVRVPFPVRRLYAEPDTELDDGAFVGTCAPKGERTQLCLTLSQQEWPQRVAPLECDAGGQTVRMVPVPAFDPSEHVWDGVSIVRRVDSVQAAFQLEGVPDASGMMAQGSCGVSGGHFWVQTVAEPRRQSCLLLLSTGERRVPIRLVAKLGQNRE